MIFEHLITKSVSGWYADYRYDIGTGKESGENRTFKTETQARQYITQAFKDAVLIRYEKFVKSLKPYVNEKNSENYDTAVRSIEYFLGQDIAVIKTYMPRMVEKLQSLLPAITGKNFIKLKNELELIVRTIDRFEVDK